MPRETPAPRGDARDADDGAQPRAVPCRDHAFDESLVCRCGTSWWSHQLRPRPCPARARARNRHSTPLCAGRPELDDEAR